VNVIAASSLVIALVAIPLSSAIAANDGTIEISGRITATTCEVEGKPPGSGAVTKTVDFGDISAGNLATEGQTSGDRGFQIHIGGNTECVDGGLAKIRFDPASPSLDRTTGRLNIDAVADAAKNVQIQIANQDGTPINMYTEDSQGTTIVGNSAVIPLIARYYSTGKAEKGAANSRVGFQVVYQ
jgi:major type 1 subunit fimbrin (pilin)